MTKLITDRQDDLKALCKRFNVKRLYAFGSAVSERFSDSSDIDFLLTFSDELSPEEYSENYFALHQHLSELFHREIDLVTERSLSNPYLIASIHESRQLVYEA